MYALSLADRALEWSSPRCGSVHVAHELSTMRIILSSLLTLVALSLTVHTAHAEARAAPVLTFREALRRAREQPPSVLAALAGLSRAQAEAAYARGARLPRVSVEGSSAIAYSKQPALTSSMVQEQAVPTVGHIDAVTRVQRGTLSLEMAVLDLARWRSIDAADRGVDVQDTARAETVRDALDLAARLYVSAVATRDLVADAQLTLERRTSQHAAIRTLVRAGLHPAVDAARAEIEVVAARFALETREVEREASQAALAAALGIDPAQAVHPSDFDDAALPTPLAPEHAADLAAVASPQAQRGIATLAQRSADHRTAVAARLPTVGLVGSGSASHVGVKSGLAIEGASYDASAGVYLRWSALEPTTWRRAHVTHAAVGEAERQRDAALLAVRAETTATAFEVKRTRAALGQAMEVWNAAQAARTAQNARYKEGVATLLELLDAESVEQAARRQRIEALRDYRTAQTRLLAVCGVIDKLAE